MRNFILLMSLILNMLLFGCRNKVSTSDSLVVNNIDASVDKSSVFQYSEYVDTSDLTFCFLETRDDILIGELIQFYIFNNYYVISTKRKVFIFDFNGKYIASIYHLGKGKGEYLALTDVYVDKNDFIYILDQKLKEILKYNFKGEFITSYNVGVVGKRFNKLNEDIWAIYTGSITVDSNYRLNYFSEKKNKIVRQFQYIHENERSWMHFSETGNFFEYGDKTFFYTVCNDTIYEINEEGIRPDLKLNHGKNSLPSYIRNGQYKDVREFLSKIEGKDYVSRLFNFTYNETTASFGILLNSSVNHVLVNHKSNKTICIKAFKNGTVDVNKNPYFLLPEIEHKGYFYKILYIDELSNIGIFHGDDKRLLNVNRNPVIVRFKFKL
ncbi:6-bladed beta-propeller [Saccharicrinis sp. FJH2]|uniref:6-bladed beta-propeller n=1 Tax=Saccharicrinis sp. FJH65 TaxID=3344659 RepID=UPI0035F4DDDE